MVGLDGSGKSSALELMVKQHANEANGVSIGVLNLPKYTPVQWRMEHIPIGRRIAGLIDGATLLGDRANSKLLAGMVYAFFMGLCYNPFQEVLSRWHNPSILLRKRDPSIDGPVYGSWYLPFMDRLSNGERLFLVTEVLHIKLPQKVIYFDVEPQIAYDRIMAEFHQKSWTGRKRKPHLHETPETLQKLRQEYHQVLTIAAAKGVEVVTINTTKASLSEVASELYNHINASLASPNLNWSSNGVGVGPSTTNVPRPTTMLVVR